MKLKDQGTGKVLEGTFHVQELKPCIRSDDRSDGVESDSSQSSDDTSTPKRVLRPRGKTQAKLQNALTTLGGKGRV